MKHRRQIVAQTSQSAVSRVSQPASRSTSRCFQHSHDLPIGKSAIQQVWKPALRAFAAWPQVEPAIHVPRTDREYRQLVESLDHLVDEVGEREDHPLASLMEVIGVLIEKYKDEHVAELA